MQKATTSRVQKRYLDRVFYKGDHRAAFPYLMEDFAGRCAYSMRHIISVDGPGSMNVDHFNPRKKKDQIQYYTNFFLSTSHCNRHKSNQWPTNKERANGIRFLDCSKEIDYGVHIFEDPDTHELVDITRAGRYHVDACDLNAAFLTDERS